ncbi:TPA: hypothetical protein ACT96X_002439 [Legionella pneumophila]|uniref:hypothetical protein n=1 Tax=Legionella pneumophila TaxID=446 RepID=UPI00078865C3|nr:hypothetical protein [Legionella pneumophila]HAU1192459.1 hypothetical protein [Legionella pneumophila]HBD7102750.1 hypothetical protein [Legionella pneumophila]HCO4739480.1 hypothetical protein [Legionella pneumophila]HEG4430068.1 hypothetical protein [Legionella pneumophila]HEG4433127.1 hypothetical protein [Legionella pneumophila]
MYTLFQLKIELKSFLKNRIEKGNIALLMHWCLNEADLLLECEKHFHPLIEKSKSDRLEFAMPNAVFPSQPHGQNQKRFFRLYENSQSLEKQQKELHQWLADNVHSTFLNLLQLNPVAATSTILRARLPRIVELHRIKMELQEKIKDAQKEIIYLLKSRISFMCEIRDIENNRQKFWQEIKQNESALQKAKQDDVQFSQEYTKLRASGQRMNRIALLSVGGASILISIAIALVVLSPFSSVWFFSLVAPLLAAAAIVILTNGIAALTLYIKQTKLSNVINEVRNYAKRIEITKKHNIEQYEEACKDKEKFNEEKIKPLVILLEEAEKYEEDLHAALQENKLALKKLSDEAMDSLSLTTISIFNSASSPESDSLNNDLIIKKEFMK